MVFTVDYRKWQVKVVRLLPDEVSSSRELAPMPNPSKTLRSEVVWIYLSIMCDRLFPGEIISMIGKYIDECNPHAKTLDLIWRHMQGESVYFVARYTAPTKGGNIEVPRQKLHELVSQEEGAPLRKALTDTENIVSAKQKALYEAIGDLSEPLADRIEEVKEAIRDGANPSDSAANAVNMRPPLLFLIHSSSNPVEDIAEYIKAVFECGKKIDFNVIFSHLNIIEELCCKIYFTTQADREKWEDALGLIMSIGAEHTEISLQYLNDALPCTESTLPEVDVTGRTEEVHE